METSHAGFQEGSAILSGVFPSFGDQLHSSCGGNVQSRWWVRPRHRRAQKSYRYGSLFLYLRDRIYSHSMCISIIYYTLSSRGRRSMAVH